MNHRAAVIIASGFTQGRYADSGMQRLHDDMRDKIDDDDVFIELCKWNDNAAELAYRIHSILPPDAPILHVSHSYGAGRFTIAFAKALGRLTNTGLLTRNVYPAPREIAAWWAIDPVPRYFAAKFVSLFGWGTIKIPANVRWVQSWRQTGDKWYLPKGVRLKQAANAGTQLHEEHVTLCQIDGKPQAACHANIDNCESIRAQVTAGIIKALEKA